MDGYTIPQAADLAGVGRRELREAVERGELSAVRRDGRWWLQLTDAEDLRRKLNQADRRALRAESADGQLARLTRELEELKARVAALEAGEPPPQGADRPMRSALTPLFKNSPRR